MNDRVTQALMEPGVEPVMFNPLRFGGNAIRSAVAAALALPGRAMTAAGDLQRTGDQYDPAPAVDAAMMTMGGTAFGAPRGAIGAGPSRLPLPTAQPEIMPPARSIAGPAELEWTKPLLDIGFHPQQLANMTSQQIAEAGIKAVQARLGPMARTLREMGYTPQEMINMNPKDAYQAIKNKVISQ
jgi:hypothetical protein